MSTVGSAARMRVTSLSNSDGSSSPMAEAIRRKHSVFDTASPRGSIAGSFQPSQR